MYQPFLNTPHNLPDDVKIEATRFGRHLQLTLGNHGAEKPLSKGEIRLLQAYLRTLGYYGDPETVRGIDVVSGLFDLRTFQASLAFLKDHGEGLAMPLARPTHQLLDAVRDYFTQTMASRKASAPQQAELEALDLAFKTDRNHPYQAELEKLHPAIRLPLAEALSELAAKGVAVKIVEGYRPPVKQEALVMAGNSMAPPGWSMHGYGLAVDLAPAGGSNKDRLNPNSPQWQTIMEVMQRHGFSSLYREQRWDLPHFELPVKTARLVQWPADAAGWKVIPDDVLPPAWRTANARAVAQK